MTRARPGLGSVVIAALLMTLTVAPGSLAQTADPEIFVVDDVLLPGVPNCEQEPGEYVTIQSAVDAAAASGSPGEKIVKVCPGVYSEYVVVPAPMTINGAQVGNDGRQRSTATTPLDEESFLTGPDEPPANGVPAGFFLTSSDITIDGFYMGGFNETLSSGVSGAAVHTNPAVGDHLIQNNVITGNTFGMNLHGSGGSVIRRNQFRSNNQPGGASGTGIYSDQGFLNSTITENSFINNNEQGIVLLEAPGVVEGITISGNHFQGNGRSVVLGLTDRVTLRNNVSLDSTGNGFVLEGGNVGTVIEDNLVSGAYSGLVLTKEYCCGPAAINTGTVVRENSFTDNAQNGIHVQEGGASSTTIRENHLRSNLTGIRVTGSSTPALNPTVIANRISGNGAGMVNTSPSVTVLADNNWWGCNGGPAAAGCDTAAPRITTAPWIVMKLTSSKASLAPQETAVITADMTKNSTGGTVSGSSLPDDTTIVFATDRGTLSEQMVALGSDGMATTVLKHTGVPGTARVTADLDNEEEAVTVTMSGTSPSPSPTASPSPSPSASPSGSPSPSPTPSASASPSPSPSPSGSVSPSPSPSSSASPTPGPSPTSGSDPECSDGLDNDGDGEIDHPADEDCVDPEDDDESHLDPEPTCPGYEGDDRDQIVGTSGDDNLEGTEGDDVICAFGGDDTISGGGGDDVILAGRGNDEVSGSLGRDILRGGAGRDSIRGGGGADDIFGGKGPDVLRGGKGRDRIDGSPGRDTCIGGAGRNLFKDCELGRGRQR